MDTIKSEKIIKIFANPNDLFHFAAKDFKQRAITSVNEKGLFSVVLAGGNTPKLFFDILTDEYYKNSIPWQQIQFFFGDERFVPSNNVKSNYHMAYEHLFSKVSVKPENIYRIKIEFNNPKDAAKNYEHTLRKIFHSKNDAYPQFDLVYLGLGEDAPTASLMPCSDVVQRYTEDSSTEKNNQLVASLFIAASNLYRITLTPSAINHSQDIIFLVTGASKADAVRAVLEGQADPLHYPAQLIHGVHKKTLWYLDQAAAGKLSIANSK